MADDNKMKMIVRSIDAAIEDDDNNIVSRYINPVQGCLACNTPQTAVKINEAYLGGFTYPRIIDMYGEEVERKTGYRLTNLVLSEHFSKHFDVTGAAIAEYNRLKGQSLVPVEERKKMVTIFDAIVSERINDIELLDLSMKEQIKRLQELENIKTDRISTNRTGDLEHLIMKQEVIANNLMSQVVQKLKIWQKAQLQNKQMELMETHMQFLDAKTASFLGFEGGKMDREKSQEVERIYLKVVIESMVKNVSTVLDTVFQVDGNQKAQFFKEFNRACKGLEKKITDEFKEKLREAKDKMK
jgi:hypothetical protein